MSYAQLGMGGFVEELADALRERPEITVRFLLLSQSYHDLDGVASLTGLTPVQIRENLRQLRDHLVRLQNEGLGVQYVEYSQFPTAGCWIVDPRREDGWCRIEVFLHHREDRASRANIVLTKADDPFFFRKLYDALQREWTTHSSAHEAHAEIVEDAELTEAAMVGGAQGTDLLEQSLTLPSASWPQEGAQVLCVTFPTMNLSEMRSFYASHDPLIAGGGRGADAIPPRTPEGVFRLVLPADPRTTYDLTLPRPSGFAYDSASDRFLVACQADNTIVEISRLGIRQFASHPLFNHLHSLDLHEGVLAIASSGTDAVLAFDAESGEEVFRWIALDHGYNKRADGRLRRIDPEADHRSQQYPTLEQATHVNSVVISRTEPGVLYASLFHQGEIVRIDMATGKTEVVQTGFDHPHGLKSDGNGHYIVASASHGRFHLLDSHLTRLNVYCDPATLWLQDACALTPDIFAYTDVYGSAIKCCNIRSRTVLGAYLYEEELKVYQVGVTHAPDLAYFSWLGELRRA